MASADKNGDGVVDLKSEMVLALHTMQQHLISQEIQIT
jgi:hypothetical protein